MLSRRDFGRTAALAGLAWPFAGVAWPGAAAMTVRGVRIGIISGSLNPLPQRPRDPIDVIDQCLALGVVDVELVTMFPPGRARGGQWRPLRPTSGNRADRRALRDPGGVAPTRAGTGPERGGHRGQHGEPAGDVEGLFHQPRHRALHGREQRCRGVLRKHPERISHQHVTDRRRDNGPNVELGAGDTPITECVTLIRDQRWPIKLTVEREYRDAPGTPVEQTRWQLNYLRSTLEN